MELYKVFIIQAYESKTADGTLLDNVVLELIDITPRLAIEKAKKIIKKNNYRVSGVIEKEKGV